MSNVETISPLHGLEIAVIDMAGRFPGARTLDDFWNNLCDGVEAISFFTDEELAASVDQKSRGNPNYVRARGILDDIEHFDAEFFGFNPREAEIMDPQQRLFLEVAWEALERAGYDANQSDDLIGVYAGAGISTYLLSLLTTDPERIDSIGTAQAKISNDKDHVTTQVGYKLNLKGPSITVQTTCSTSLVAICLACQGLLSGQCDMALAGGVKVTVPQKIGYFYEEGGVNSPDGHCRAFDAAAQGTVSGDGVGIVVLKRLEDALADGDMIQAVIKGFAINNDGAMKVGYTAPGVEGQGRVIRAAQRMAEVDPETITYVEAHGTGTILGDPIEIAALTQAFRAATRKTSFCAVGSVKTNIGHLDTAAGVAGFIKTVLALQHKRIPPSLHFRSPNPQIDFAHSPFYVNAQLTDWDVPSPRRAGVSSFGIGGTNAHVILEEAPAVDVSDSPQRWQLLLLSAKTDTALEAMTDQLARHLEQHDEINITDVAYTLQVGRKAFSRRRMLVCRDRADALDALTTRDPKRVYSTTEEPGQRSVVFMFPGVGDQYPHMAAELYSTMPVFREQIDRCADLLRPLLGCDLRDLLYPGGPAESPTDGASGAQIDLRKMLRREEDSTAAAYNLNQTRLLHPAVFAVEYALARLWMDWGLHPEAMIGYSIGEYVAACLAGVFTFDDALLLVARRAQMIDALPPGAMLAVQLSPVELEPLLAPEISVAAINRPSLCVVSGPQAAVERFAQQLANRGVACRMLQATHAFHSRMMEPLVDALARMLAAMELKPPATPFVSNVTGTWITAEQATDPGYWARHLCDTVRFADGIDTLLDDAERIFLEIGPGRILSSFVFQHLQDRSSADHVVLSSLRYSYEQQSDVVTMLTAAGQLWLSGGRLAWAKLYAHQRRHRLALPTYPFERRRYWIDPRQPGEASARLHSTDRKQDVADWFYIPSWKRSLPPIVRADQSGANPERVWLLFVDEVGIGAKIAGQLRVRGQSVATVAIGECFSQPGETHYTINPHSQSDYHDLLEALHAQNRLPDAITHLWTITTDAALSGIALFQAAQHRGFFSLLFLTQALGKRAVTKPLDLWVVSHTLYDVESGDRVRPEHATIGGLCKVVPQEYTNITCRNVDIALPEGDSQEQQVIDQLLAELLVPAHDHVIAYRGHHRTVQSFEPVRLDVGQGTPLVREGGVYLITGGLGTIGSRLAEHLARSRRAKLALLGRSGLPAREEWQRWLAAHASSDQISARIRQVQRLEALGADVLIVKADVACLAEMHEAIAQILTHFGALHGVIHAAGIVETGSVTQISVTGYAESERHFRPKAHGLYVLRDVLQDQALDFCLLLSSISSVLGGLELGAYASANAFMDAFARQQHTRGGVPWLSIDWGEVGTLEDTADVFLRLVSHRLPAQVVVSPTDLAERIRSWVELVSVQRADGEPRAKSEARRHVRPNLQTTYVAPRNMAEERIAEMWCDLLGVRQVGVYDSFFALGGHSLIATQLISRLRAAFQVELPLRVIFSAPTVADLALTVEAMIIAEIQAGADLPASSFAGDAVGAAALYPLREAQHYVLPNQMPIMQQNRVETDHFYQDIFEHEVYIKHGITLPPGACVFDVGANIGLFTLFVHHKCPDARIYAFEPAPQLFDIVQSNVAMHDVHATLFNCGLSNSRTTATFTFYPHSSGMSSFYANVGEEKEVLRTIMLNQLQEGADDIQQLMHYSEELLEERFRSETFICELRTLHDIFVEHHVQHIDLLKIDVQKSELDVLSGIAADEWQKIRQIVVEVHDIDGRLDQLRSLLEAQRYEVIIEQDDLYKGSIIYNVYAIRRESEAPNERSQ